MQCKIVFVSFALAFALSTACASGGSELPPSDSAAVVRPVGHGDGDPLVVAAYVVSDTENRNYTEGMYLPQAAAAFLPTSFSVSSKDRRLLFDHSLPYRILSRSALKGDVLLYSIELSPFTVDFKGKRYDDGRSYTFSFPRSALGRAGGALIQPAQFAIERAIRISSIANGLARIEALRFDEATEVFKASVSISAQSIKR